MQLDKETLKRVASVARINLTKSEEDGFLSELKEILNAFSEISKLDTTNVGLSIQPLPVVNSFREDLIKESLSQDDALFNTTHKKEGYFKAPRVI